MTERSRADNYQSVDLDYQVQIAKTGNMFKAAWGCVWGPLCGRGFHRGPKGAEFLNNQVRRRWHALLFALKDVGWGPACNPGSLVFMRNCPPFGVVSNHLARPCKHGRVCPFCWGRQVLTIYDRVKRLLLHGIPKSQRKQSRLISFAYSQRFSLENGNAAPENLAKRIQLARLTELSVLQQQKIKPLGTYINHTIEYFPRYVKFIRSGLIVLNQAGHLRRDVRGLKAKRYCQPTVEDLEEAVELACRYPVRQFLCNPHQLREWLDYANSIHLRCSSFHGKLRG